MSSRARAFEALATARPRDVNLRVAVGDAEDSVSFFLTHPYLGLSTLDPAVHAHVADVVVEEIEEVRVSQRRLASILAEHAGDRTIHFLKVDVEGAEYQVLASSDWTIVPTYGGRRRVDRVIEHEIDT